MRDILSLRNVSLIYHTNEEETLAIKDVSFDVKDGEFISLVGPSGCGKTSILSLIAGLLSPTTGTIKLDGNIVKSPSTDVGYMLQKDELLPWRSIYKNIGLGIEIKKIIRCDTYRYLNELIDKYGINGLQKRFTPIEDYKYINGLIDKYGIEAFIAKYGAKAEKEKAQINYKLCNEIKKAIKNETYSYIDELISKYGLSEFKNHYPNQLSGGMRQRAALIRTLATNPKILLLDEPFSALDYQTRLGVCDDVFTIIEKEKKTAILVTHDISEAISVSDRIIVLSKRPAVIKKVYDLSFRDFGTPLKRREHPSFAKLFESIWRDISDDK